MEVSNVYRFQDEENRFDQYSEYSSDIRDTKLPLVIDNGGHCCRTGWLTDKTPKLVFRNLIAKPKARKEADSGITLIGNEINFQESLKWSFRTQFDRDVVTHFDAQEQIFDYMFSHLGINTEGCVDHPMILTEAVANPNSCRQFMSELLFECYNVPQVSYGIDSLFSFKKNLPEVQTGLIISSGYQSTHILPIIDAKIDTLHAKRINVGGAKSIAFMQKIMQLKYPGHALAISLPRAEELLKRFGYLAVDYKEELQSWTKENFADTNGIVVQLPYMENPIPVVKNPEKEKERRIKQGKRLQEINARRREEKLTRDELRFSNLKRIRELESINEIAFEREIKAAGISSSEALDNELQDLATSIENRKQKILQSQQEDIQPVSKKPKEEEDLSELPSFRMNEEEVQEWLESLRRERSEIMENRKLRQRRKEELSNRKSHASKERMRILSKLSGTEKSSRRKMKEDTFGMNDEDWEVYKYISKEASESEDEQEQERLQEIESLLNQHEPKAAGNNPKAGEHFDIGMHYRLHLGIERIRPPEILYQPNMLGLEQAGIAETIQYVLSRYPTEIQNKLVEHIFLTGGNTKFPGFEERLEKELIAIRPFGSSFKIYKADDPVLDAWIGARDWAQSVPDLSSVSITRKEYDDLGGEYLKEHGSSNLYIPTPSAPS